MTSGGVTKGLEMLVRAINPIPAYVRNTRLDILAWNNAIADLLVDYGSLQPHERNTLRLLSLYRPYRTLILDWEQMARGMISTFRASRVHAQDKVRNLTRFLSWRSEVSENCATDANLRKLARRILHGRAVECMREPTAIKPRRQLK